MIVSTSNSSNFLGISPRGSTLSCEVLQSGQRKTLIPEFQFYWPEDPPKLSCWKFIKKKYEDSEEYLKATGHGINALNYISKAAILMAISLISKATGEGSRNDWVGKLVTGLKFAPIISAPFALYDTCYETYHCITGKEKVDSALRATEGLAWLTESIAAFLEELTFQGAAAQAASTAVLTLSGISVALWTATIVLNVKYHIENLKAMKDIDATLTENGTKTDFDVHDYCRVLKHLSRDPDAKSEQLETDKKSKVKGYNDYALKKHFGVEGKELRPLLIRIEENVQFTLEEGRKAEARNDTSSANKLNKEALTTAETAVNSLKGRIKNKNFFHKVSILSAIIYLIGVALLLFPPAAIAAYTLLTIGACISLINTLWEKRSARLFEEQMRNLALRRTTPTVNDFSIDTIGLIASGGSPPPKRILRHGIQGTYCDMTSKRVRKGAYCYSTVI